MVHLSTYGAARSVRYVGGEEAGQPGGAYGVNADPKAAGLAYGNLYEHDAKALLIELEGCEVKLVTPGVMCRIRGRRPGEDRAAGWYVRAAWNEPAPTVYIDVTLSERQQALTMAHEWAHMAHSNWTESECETFAQAFLNGK